MFGTDWAGIRGAHEFNVRAVKLGGRGATCGATGILATGLAATAGAARLVTVRGEAVCIVALIAWAPAVLMLARSDVIKQKAANSCRFIRRSDY
jgi:hypothetical protein